MNVFDQARIEIVNRGWAKNWMIAPTGAVCLTGALGLAAGVSVSNDDDELYRDIYDAVGASRFGLLTDVLAAYVTHDRDDPVDFVVFCNDHSDTTEANVLEWLAEASRRADQVDS